ncbi:MAG: PAS domain S-box protein [Cyanobacteriota bacterium]
MFKNIFKQSNILLIEDNPNDCKLFMELFHEKTGITFNFEIAGSLKESISKINNIQFDLILLDFGLPDSQGYETFEKIKNIAHDVPIIILTGLEDEELSAKALSNGAQDYINKNALNTYPLDKTLYYAIERYKLIKNYTQTKEKLELIYAGITDGLIIADINTRKFVEVNSKILEMLNYTKEELLNFSIDNIHPKENLEYVIGEFNKLTQGIKNITHDIPVLKKDGSIIYVDIAASSISINDRECLLGFFRDVSERKNTLIKKTFNNSILNHLNISKTIDEALTNVIDDFKNYFNFDAVGIRLRKEFDYPYYKTFGFSKEFLVSENTLCYRDKNNEIILDDKGVPLLQCVCGLILRQETDCTLPFFNEYGSLCINDLQNFTSMYPDIVKSLNIRGMCISEGYESLMLVPIKAEKDFIGLLHICSLSRNQFSSQDISFFENITANIGIAISKLQLKQELLEYREILEQTVIDKTKELNKQNQILKSKQMILDSINTILNHSILNHSIHSDKLQDISCIFLSKALELTESEYGFVGKINDKGNFDIITHSLSTWKVCNIANSECLLQNMTIKGVWGKAILLKQNCIVNDPKNDIYSIGLPKGHPPLNNFLGVLLWQKDKIFGMIGLANKMNGYSNSDIELVENLIPTFFDTYHYKVKENELIKVNSILSTISNNALDAIIMINSNGKILHWNKAAEIMFGYSFDEAINKDLHELIVSQELIVEYIEGIKHYKKTGEGKVIGKTIELKAMKKDKSEIDVEISVASIKINYEWNAVGIVRDISKRKDIEAKMSRFIKALADINLELEEANKHKSFFLSTMSHELRTPLNAILGFSQSLEKQYFGPLNAKQLEYIQDIYSSGNHLLSLINDILDIAKIDANTIDLNIESFPVVETIKNIITMFKVQFEKKQINFEYTIETSINNIKADKKRFKQILLNLISNSIKYSNEKGQIKLEVTKLKDNFIYISVTDKGVGLKKNECKKIFSEFYQTDHTRDQALGGTGIGLALCKRLVNMHKGEIGVESEYGEGSKFWFTLPVD